MRVYRYKCTFTRYRYAIHVRIYRYAYTGTHIQVGDQKYTQNWRPKIHTELATKSTHKIGDQKYTQIGDQKYTIIS
eukprot:SAG11_NODE_2495_length_3290_cov_25.090254_4_plen_76_part_00